MANCLLVMKVRVFNVLIQVSSLPVCEEGGLLVCGVNVFVCVCERE